MTTQLHAEPLEDADAEARAALGIAPVLEPVRVIELAEAPKGARDFARRLNSDCWAVALTYAKGWKMRKQSTDYTTGEGKRPKLEVWEIAESVAVRIRRAAESEGDGVRAVVLYVHDGRRGWNIDESCWWQLNVATLSDAVPVAYHWPRPIGVTDLGTALAADDVLAELRAGTERELVRRAEAAKRAKKGKQPKAEAL